MSKINVTPAITLLQTLARTNGYADQRADSGGRSRDAEAALMSGNPGNAGARSRR